MYYNGTRVTATYDAVGRQLAMGDVTGTTTYAYDALGRATSVLYPIGKALTYSYDAVGNRSGLVDQDGGLTTYAYDALNRPSTILNPFAETTRWTWDLLGRTQQQVLANGLAASYAYDAASRASALWYLKSDNTPVAMYTATYDAAGNRTGVDELDGSFGPWHLRIATDPARALQRGSDSGLSNNSTCRAAHGAVERSFRDQKTTVGTAARLPRPRSILASGRC